jgi:ubiquinone/menaquinone biosynthesis C-methylase UbiE/uncharacterized protein YbaR (Trm112 family)
MDFLHTYLIDMLVCPACHGTLRWVIEKRLADRVEAAEASCATCGSSYLVHDGIGVFLTPDLPRDDLWAQMDSALNQYLREHPDAAHQLLDVSLDALNPADQLLRSFVLNERGDFAAAKLAFDAAMPKLYTAEYLACVNSQIDFVIGQLAASAGPIVDLASGRGYLVEAMARRTSRPIVMTDFSPRVLRGNRQQLEFFGLYDRVSLLAFDARRTPFKDNTVQAMTTHLGLANIQQPGELLKELRRIVDGALLAINHFYPEDDTVNAETIRKLDLAAMLYESSALQLFAEAGWHVSLANAQLAHATPTSASQIFDGVKIDSLPVSETTLRWCTIVAR